ncbi:MAG: helix-turn-helix domain-containing protein [Alcanivorax sp.]|nr:helix-turn-helix domain-containing protein [Alcanivorax sp.]
MNKDEAALRFPGYFLETFESIVQAGGGSVRQARVACHLPEQGSLDSLSLTQFKEILRQILRFTNRKEPASLQLLRHIPVTAHGMISVAAMTTETLGQALDVALRYFPLILPTHELYRVTVGNEVQVHIQCLHALGSPFDEILTEIIPSDLFQMVRLSKQTDTATPKAASNGTIHFAHESDFEPEVYQRYFNADVEFGCPETFFSVSRNTLARPLFTRNRSTHDVAVSALESRLAQAEQDQPITRKVRRFISVSMLSKKVPDAATVAEALAMSQRTLTRRLSEEGSSLVALLESVRIEKAEGLLLGSNLPLGRIARELGYSDLSSFSRAFKRVKGIAPSKLRDPG